jgi:hypothetical protein
MTDGTNLAALLPTIIGGIGVGTVAGAFVTTYGGRGAEHRELRSKALAALEQIESRRLTTRPIGEGTYYESKAFAELKAVCMVAGVSPVVVSFYDEVCKASSKFTRHGFNSGPDQPSGQISFKALMSTLWLMDEAARLVRDSLWHPKLSLLIRPMRVRRLRSKAMLLYSSDWRGALTRRIYSDWVRAECDGRGKRRARLRNAKH